MFDQFLNWIKQKFTIHQKESRPIFEERQLWWCYFGQNVADELYGKCPFFVRPIIILKKAFKNRPTFLWDGSLLGI